jgi:hypothetical protein
MRKFDDTNEPMVGGPYRPVLYPDSVSAGKGYWIEDVEGIVFTSMRFYRLDEFDEAVALCMLLNTAFTAGTEAAPVAG